MMLQSYQMIWELLTAQEKRKFVLLILLTVLMSVFEVAGVAAIFPFLTLIGDPSLIETNAAIAFLAHVIGENDPREITIAFGLAVLVLLILGMGVRAFGTYAQVRFGMMRGHSLATRLLKTYLSQPYVWFLNQNTSEFSQSLLSEIDLVVRQSILASILMISYIINICCVIVVVFLAEPAIAIGAIGLLGGAYLAVFLLMRKRLDKIGLDRVDFNKSRFKVAHEVSGGLKEIKIMGLEDRALMRFDESAYGVAKTFSAFMVISNLPRFVLEAVIYGGFILMVLMMIAVADRDISDLVPILGLLGVASMKIFPAVQHTYSQISMMRFGFAALKRLHSNLTTLDVPRSFLEGDPIKLKSRLELIDLEFIYPNADHPTFRSLNTTITAFSTVGIVGGTGAGKTTMVDIILGLLTPSSGEFRVDGQLVAPEKLRNWQKSIGYVPQAIFLTDNTILSNIAFGVPEHEIDFNAALSAARIANLHDFVESDLADGYQTIVGERGVRLSGGQRQRIGIARALYTNPDVLILDEATSALDSITERAVMDAVHNLTGKKTVIMIAHRLSTVKECDNILVLKNGRVAAEGTFDELVKNHREFRRLANI